VVKIRVRRELIGNRRLPYLAPVLGGERSVMPGLFRVAIKAGSCLRFSRASFRGWCFQPLLTQPDAPDASPLSMGGGRKYPWKAWPRKYWLQHRTLLVLLLAILTSTASAYGQQIPAWRVATSVEPNQNLASGESVRIAIKEKCATSKNILELDDVADLSGSESMVAVLQDLPIGLAPALGKQQSWTQDELIHVLGLRGFDTKQVRWAGASACHVTHQTSVAPEKKAEFTKSFQPPPTTIQAEKNVTSVILLYLQNKGPVAAGWIVNPTIPSEQIKLLSQRQLIKGITGGTEPWTGTQKFTLLVQNAGGETTVDIEADIQLPPMIIAACGPLAKGRVIAADDLKLVRLTSSMKASVEECYEESELIIGKELRRNISSGQPIQRTDTGPVTVIHAKEVVRIQVVSGAIVAEASGRALQSGGQDELIQVEVSDSKKRLASRVIGPGLVEVITR
jgi:flagella basal body P-ring formation protein FlgA